MRKTLLALATAAVLALPASASTRPMELGTTITATQPYGSGKLTWLVFTAYDATLWTDAPQWSMNAPFALTLSYRMGFSTQELVERTIDEMEKVAPSSNSHQRFAAPLTKAFPSVKDGERITALYVPGQPVRFYHNGRATSEIADAGFAEPFFGVWFSPRTSEPRLREALLRLR